MCWENQQVAVLVAAAVVGGADWERMARRAAADRLGLGGDSGGD